MKLFPWRKKKLFFSEEENRFIVDAICEAEKKTSGEVRVFVESYCKYVDAIDRAVEIFRQLRMDQTKDRNATLVYVAVKDHQLAILGDEGIHQKVGSQYWSDEVSKMISDFNKDNIAGGIRQCVLDIGDALHKYFPYDKDTDKNELPDDIVFGR